MNQIIPIFPLNLVVYPGSLYPLHIFEERYKKLIARSEHYEEGFGIVANTDEKLANVGCYVELEKIFKKYPNGSMDILVRGVERFHLMNTWTHEEGYLEASILQFGDSDNLEQSHDELFEKTLNVFKSIIDRTALELDKSFWRNLESAQKKSFKLAEKSGMNLNQQQKLLSLKSENERLNFLHAHLLKLESKLDKTEALREIIMSDGFVDDL